MQDHYFTADTKEWLIIIGFLISVFIAPSIGGLVSKMIKDKEERDKERQSTITEKIELLSKKITSFCTSNHEDHEQLFEDKNDLMTRVKAIETIHKLKGCDQPMGRQNA